MNELNQKCARIKSDYKFDCKRIEFLDSSVYIDQQNELQTTFFRKPSDSQNFLNAKSGNPYLLRKLSTTVKHLEFGQYVQHSKTTTITSENLLNKLLIKDTKNNVVIEQIQKVDQVYRKQLLH